MIIEYITMWKKDDSEKGYKKADIHISERGDYEANGWDHIFAEAMAREEEAEEEAPEEVEEVKSGLEEMTKGELAQYAEVVHGVTIDKRKSLISLIELVKELDDGNNS